MHKKQKTRPWGIFLAIGLAIAFGSLTNKETSLFGISLYRVFDTAGIVFLNALTLIVVPLISSSIISGIARIGGEESFKRIGVKMFSFYLGTSLLAILIGLFFVNLVGPGYYHAPMSFGSTEIEQISQVSQGIPEKGSALFNLLISVVPSNLFKALAQGDMIALIFFSLIFGYVITKIDVEASKTLQSVFRGVFQAMIRFTHIIMKFLPYGVFCLVSKAFMDSGIGSIFSVGAFLLTVILGFIAFTCIGLPLLLKYVGKVSPVRHFRAMTPALATAFSTSSSAATLPITIDCVEKRAGVSNRICSLVVPLGTSLNMSGSALYECVAALFVAQVYGIDLSFSTQFLVVILSLITSIGVAGIPSASLVAVLIIFRVIGLPPEGIGLFIAVDRLLDMCRTTVNVFSDACCAVLIARSEGEKNILNKNTFDAEET